MKQELSRETLAGILQAEDVSALSFTELARLFREEPGVSGYLPDGVCQIDPRNGDRIIYHSARARRPHDNRPARAVEPEMQRECIICQGRTTGVIDVADLSQGFTFINKNLFPVLYPFERAAGTHEAEGGDHPPGPEGRPAYGFHLLQWTSSQHDKDWHNMPVADCTIVMQRLAALEHKLIRESGGLMPGGQDGSHGFVLIIKNYGHLVGGSLIHGHQQIAFSNIVPRHLRDNGLFEKERGEPFSAYLLRENPAELVIKDYGPAMLVVPYFMRRPFDMMLLMKQTGRAYLHELNPAEIAAAAAGWHDAIRAVRWIMPEIGREIAYNVITNNGPGAGLYFEFLPFTQEIGGAEHLGLIVCQQNPQDTAARVREFLLRAG